MKPVLMVAFHYPPAGYSSGMQRTLKFSRHLGEFGWKPIVLTAHPRAYRVTRSDQLADIPSDVVVRRAFALDASRHMKLFGRYPRFAALPDSWVSWWLGGVMAGRKLIAQYRPRLIWSTYPITTAHMIASTLRRSSKLPWVADFRDPMVEGYYPPDERQRRAYASVERRTIKECSRAVFTTEGARRLYAGRYPEVGSGRFQVVANGFDEEAFADAERLEPDVEEARVGKIVLLHSGTLYRSERDPSCFYGAIAKLMNEGRIDANGLRIVLRAPGFLEYNLELIESFRIGSVVRVEGGLPYRPALREMLDADGLLVFQASNCNHQVPAKVYEYMRARRPILALTDPKGDTARTLREAGFQSIAPLDDESKIASAIVRFLEKIRCDSAYVAADSLVTCHSRRTRTETLARIFDDAVRT